MSMETDKIILRPWRESDAEALFKYASDPDVGPRAGWPPHKSKEESLEIIRTVFHNDHTWAIELKQTGESIGCIGYYLYGESNIAIGEQDAEVGYWVAKPYWNQGICSEALRLMIDYCFQEQHFKVLWCDCFVDNPASERVMHKCGFRDTGAFNLCSHLYLGDDRLVKIMRLDRCAYIETKLFALQDKAYADFQSKLLPTVKRETVIGVRTPDLRKIAKQICKTPAAQEFLHSLPHRYFDENQLHAFILSEEKDFDRCLEELEQFLPYVDNWATCDQLSPRFFKKHTTELLPYVRKWMRSKHTYTKRFGICTLMRYFWDEAFRPEYLEWVASIKSDEYYIRMMQAWFFATALAKQWDATLPYIEQHRLEKDTHNKTIQKAIESFRITDEQKALLKTLRVK